jgi:hypothetical protein
MKKLGVLAAVLSVAGVFALGGAAMADSQLTLAPVASEHIILEAGMQQSGSFTVYNTGTEKLDIEVKGSELCVNDSYAFTFEGCSVASSTTMKNWITASAEKATLEPNEETKVNYTINVPATGLPGGSQHAGVTVTFKGKDSGDLDVNYTLGYRLFAYNPIGAKLSETLVSAKVDRLQFKKPLQARMTAKNDGNVDFFAKTTMTVSSIGGKEVNKTENNHVVMPGTTREVKSGWDGSPHLGLFKVKYEVILEDIDGKMLESKTIEKMVLIMPLFMFVIILVVIAALLVFLVLRLKKNAELKNARKY